LAPSAEGIGGNNVIVHNSLTKRAILLLFTLTLFVVIAACGASEQVIKEVEVIKEVPVEKIVIQEVIKEVPVERIVVEKVVSEVEVIKEVPVEKIVEKEVVVIKEITKEVVVQPTPGPKRTLVFAGLDWDSAQVQNGVARYIVEKGYGHETEQIEGSTVPLFQGLIKHDVDITMEIWLPNQIKIWNEATKNGQVIGVGKSLEDNWQSTFVVPTYLVEENPGLKSVSDIPAHKELWAEPDSGGKAVLIGCIAGWSCRRVNEEQLVSYGLEDSVELRDPGSQAGLFASLEGAYKKKEPWLGYLWGPTKIANELDLTLLEEPAADGCSDPGEGCGFPPAEVLIAVNNELIEDAPDVIAFLRKWDWNGVNQLFAEAYYNENKDESDEPYRATAVYFLKNSDDWTGWVPSDVEKKIKDALAAE
jgi:glycine betaine/proline transport system substrate-binding protein